MTQRAAIHGKGREVLNRALGNHEAFKTSGALSGETGVPSTHVGRLTGTDLDVFRQNRDRITYTVYSYGTPIGWVYGDGTVYRVSQRFSVTTSKHQGTLYLL